MTSIELHPECLDMITNKPETVQVREAKENGKKM